MALTVDSAPDGFQPIGAGELIYQFTEASVAGKPNYRVEIEFDSLTLPVFSFRPNTSLVIEADIATILRSVLRYSFSETERFGETYVKYQAVWDGGSDAQVPLTSNVIWFYVGSDNILNHRTQYHIGTSGGPFLYPFDELKSWLNRSAFIDFVHDDQLSADSFVSVKDTQGNLETILSFFDGSVSALKKSSFVQTGVFDIFNVTGFIIKATQGAAESTTYKLYFGSADIDQGLAQSISMASGFDGRSAFISFYIRKVGNPTQTVTFKLYAGDAITGLPTGSVLASFTVSLSGLQESSDGFNVLINFSSYLWLVLSGPLGAYCITFEPNNDGVGDASNYYSIKGAGSAGIFRPLQRKTAGVWANLNDRTSWIVGGDISGGGVPEQTIDIVLVPDDNCNPIYLKWINSYGGIMTWLFSEDQIFAITPQEDGQFKIMTVAARGLTDQEWLTLNELNKTGAELQDNNKLGAFVNDITDEDNFYVIYVLARGAERHTKKSRHELTLDLRYPIIENIGI